MKRWVEIYRKYDWTLLIASVALSAIGLLAIYGIGMSRDASDLFQFKKQLVGGVIGILIALVGPWFDYRQLRSWIVPIFGAGLGILLAVLPFGSTSRTAGRWFVFGTLSFQPVELIKIILAIVLAGYLAQRLHQRLRWSSVIVSLAITVSYVLAVALQPDFGSALVLLGMWMVVVLFCGLPRYAVPLFFLGSIIASLVLWNVGLKPYQKDRITAFLHPRSDPYGASYNVTQARIAIGSGGWLGKGIGEGSQARLRFLPEASTDFMFAVLGEELGFVGLSLTLVLFALVMYRYLRIAMDAEDAFAGILLIGLMAMMLIHWLVNAGMNLGLLPVTGIPLPFASAASSSLVSLFIAIAIAESIAVRTRRPY